MSTMDDDDIDRLLGEIEQMDDAALDALVVRAAADYNSPPAGPERPPVEAMWGRIAAARPSAPRGVRVQRWHLLAASVLFLAFGITIGRQWSAAVGSAARAGAPASRVTRPAAAPHMSAPVIGGAAVSTPEAEVADAATADRTPHATPHSAAHSAAARASGRASTGVTTSRSDAAYQLATVRHFAAAEALLATYEGRARGAKADAQTDAQLASWASDLLSQTRLLLDSPAGRDPVRRRLLQDLELVLVQMAQLSPDAPKVEHDLIDGSVRHNDIITRLRSAVPAGATTAL